MIVMIILLLKTVCGFFFPLFSKKTDELWTEVNQKNNNKKNTRTMQLNKSLFIPNLI